MKKMKDYKPIPNKKYKVLPSKNLPILMECLCALNDGRLAVGGNKKIVIYNMKTFKIDIQIQSKYDGRIKFISQLNDGNLFYYKLNHSAKGHGKMIIILIIWLNYQEINIQIKLIFCQKVQYIIF